MAKDKEQRFEGRTEYAEEGIEARINSATLRFVENFLAGKARIVVTPMSPGIMSDGFTISLDPGADD